MIIYMANVIKIVTKVNSIIYSTIVFSVNRVIIITSGSPDIMARVLCSSRMMFSFVTTLVAHVALHRTIVPTCLDIMATLIAVSTAISIDDYIVIRWDTMSKTGSRRGMTSLSCVMLSCNIRLVW
jgi:hypothetical protein